MQGARMVVLVPDAAARDAVRSIASCDPIRDLQASVSVAEAPMDVCVRETRRTLFDGPIAVLTWSEECARQAIAAGADEAFALESIELTVHAWASLVERARLKNDLRREAAPRLAAIRELERLCALGRIAAGVAEELSDPLHAALLSIELLRLDLEPLYGGVAELRRLSFGDEPITSATLRRVLGRIRGTSDTPQHARRMLTDVTEACGVITRVADALGLTSPTPELRELIDLGTMLDQILALVQRAAGKNTLIERDYAAGLPPVLAPRGQVAQVLISLVARALAGLRTRGNERHRLVLALRADERAVQLTIRDSVVGPGIDALTRLFDPTVDLMRAERDDDVMGLELAVARSVMRSMGGDLDAGTRDGEVVARFARPAPRVTAALRPIRKALPQPRRSVLVLEPDQQVLAALSPMLRQRYEVWTASDGREARGLLSDQRPDAIVAARDDLDGLKFVEWVLRERPDLTRRLVITTSHPADDDLNGLCLMEKPLEPSLLFQGLEERFVAKASKIRGRVPDAGRSAARS